jgi:hypothetical protein
MHDIEAMRAAAGRPSFLASYFVNESLNKHVGLSACMDSVAEKVMRGSVMDLNPHASEQALPKNLSFELRQLLVFSTHRVEKVRDVATRFLNRLITSFPSLMCDPPLVIAILEVLTMMSRACEDEFTDEVCTDCILEKIKISCSKIPSSILCLNFFLKELVSRCGSRIITRCGIRFWHSFKEMLPRGLSLRWLVRQQNFKPPFRSVLLHF